MPSITLNPKASPAVAAAVAAAPLVPAAADTAAAPAPAIVKEPAAPKAPKAPKEKLSRKEKLERTVANADADIAKIKAKADAAKAELEALTKLANVGVGSSLVVRVGRGDTAKTVSATVLGVKVEDGVSKYRVQYGTGFDAELAVITSAYIVEVTTVVQTGESKGDVAQAS